MDLGVSCAIHGRVVRVRNKAGYDFVFHKFRWTKTHVCMYARCRSVDR